MLLQLIIISVISFLFGLLIGAEFHENCGQLIQKITTAIQNALSSKKPILQSSSTNKEKNREEESIYTSETDEEEKIDDTEIELSEEDCENVDEKIEKNDKKNN